MSCGHVASTAWFVDLLTEKQKQALDQAAADAGEIFIKVSRDGTIEDMRNGTNKYGVSFLDVPLKPWHDRMAPVLEEFEKNGTLPKGLVDKIKAM